MAILRRRKGGVLIPSWPLVRASVYEGGSVVPPDPTDPTDPTDPVDPPPEGVWDRVTPMGVWGLRFTLDPAATSLGLRGYRHSTESVTQIITDPERILFSPRGVVTVTDPLNYLEGSTSFSVLNFPAGTTQLDAYVNYDSPFIPTFVGLRKYSPTFVSVQAICALEHGGPFLTASPEIPNLSIGAQMTDILNHA